MRATIQTEEQYDEALARVYELMQTEIKEGAPESNELESLSILVNKYENQHYPVQSPKAG
jgi:HTH-type transcriptional regulator/antitoxin HigA